MLFFILHRVEINRSLLIVPINYSNAAPLGPLHNQTCSQHTGPEKESRLVKGAKNKCNMQVISYVWMA